MRVYISGPITGYENGNREEFEVAASGLRQMGHDPVNPQCLPHDHGKTWAEYMKEDIVAMLTCDAVLALKGWEVSRGARMEVELALALGIRVVVDLWRLR
jgi:nucleoside 2-deoxyribosyltransferase